MAPTLLGGDFVLAIKRKTKPTLGSVAVIRHPHLGMIIKRILSVDDIGNTLVSGDNLMSTAPNIIGWIEETTIEYVGRWRISPFGISKLRYKNIGQSRPQLSTSFFKSCHDPL